MIELPEIFRNDIQGNTTNLVPLIVLNNRLYLSTQKTKLDKTVYHPFLHKMGKITEGVDYNKRKYKISNLKLDFYNYNYGDKKLLDAILKGETFNTNLDVYFKSQNAKSLDDCLKVYSGYIKNIEENRDFVGIFCEDKTEQVLGKEIPQRFTPTTGLDEKYVNIPVPIVYGEVNRCPLIHQFEDDITYKLISDDFPIKETSDFLLYNNDNYFEIVEDADLWKSQISGTIYDKATANQFERNENNEILIDKTIDLKDPIEANASATYLDEASPIRYGFFQIHYESDLKLVNGYYSTTAYGDVEPKYGTAPIRLYKGMEDNSEDVKYVHEGYLDVRDFGSVHEEVAQGGHWIFGDDHDFFPTDFTDGYWGKVWINLQGEPLPDENHVATHLRTSVNEEDDKEEIYPASFAYEYSMEWHLDKEYWDNVVDYGYYWSQFQYFQAVVNDNWDFLLYQTNIHNNDDVQQSPYYDDEYIIDSASDLNEFHLGDFRGWWNKKDGVTNPDLSLTNYFTNDWGEWVAVIHGGSMRRIKFNHLKQRRKIILKGFDNFKLFSYVYGRVDNSDLRYTTSITTQTTQGRAVTIKAESPKMTQKTQATGRKSSTQRKLPVKTKQTTQGKGGGY